MIEPTGLAGLHVVRQDTHEDERGFFRQTYVASELTAALGREVRFVQGNHSRSRPGVLRGFHAEPWDKLVYGAHGTVFAAVADVREASETFGQVATFELGDDPGERVQLFVAAGLANAYVAVGVEDADYVYSVSREWSPGVDKRAVAWDDPDLAVAWPVTHPVVSDTDSGKPRWRWHHPLVATGPSGRCHPGSCCSCCCSPGCGWLRGRWRRTPPRCCGCWSA